MGFVKSTNIKFEVEEIELEDRDDALDWIIKNQLGRRNLTSEQISYLRGKQYQREKKAYGGDRKSSTDNPHLISAKTYERLAEEHKVAPDTIKQDAKFAQAVDRVQILTLSTALLTLSTLSTFVKVFIKLKTYYFVNPLAALLYRTHLKSIQDGNQIWLNYELSYKFYRLIVRIFFLLFLSLNTTVL